MTQTASVRLTLTNLATEEDLHLMEERIMSALSDAVAQLKETVSQLTLAQNPEQVAQLQAAVQAEREKYDALVASEEAEDVSQNQELADARAETDALLAEMNSAASDLGGITAQLEAVGNAVDAAPDDQPVGEVPVELPPSDAEVQAPAEGGGEAETPTSDPSSTPDPSSPETPTEADTPAGGPDEPVVPATGPTDSEGRPMDAPNL